MSVRQDAPQRKDQGMWTIAKHEDGTWWIVHPDDSNVQYGTWKTADEAWKMAEASTAAMEETK